MNYKDLSLPSLAEKSSGQEDLSDDSEVDKEITFSRKSSRKVLPVGKPNIGDPPQKTSFKMKGKIQISSGTRINFTAIINSNYCP